MRRWSSLAVLMLVVPAAAAAPLPAATPPPSYLPLKAGGQWEYSGAAGGRTFQVTQKVAEEETINGVKLARVETIVDGKTVTTEHMAETDKGLFRHRYNGAKVDPPVCLLRYPVKEGDTWESDVSAGAEKAKMVCRVGSAEVEVPAGKFKAVTVRIEGETGGTAITTTYWLAKGVGVVQQEVSAGKVEFRIRLEKATPAP